MKAIGALIVALSLSIFIAWPMLREIYYSWQEGNEARRNRQKHALELEAMADSFGQNVHVVWDNSSHYNADDYPTPTVTVSDATVGDLGDPEQSKRDREAFDRIIEDYPLENPDDEWKL